MTAASDRITGFVAVPGTHLYYEMAGRGAAVVFLHAGVADSRMWRYQRNVFSDGYRAVVYDLRGFGKSPTAEGAFAHHEDLKALLDHLGIPSAYLVGVSVGAGIALDFLLSQPDRVLGLVLVSPGLGGYEDWSEDLLRHWDAEEDAFGRGDAQAVVDLNLQMWLAGPHRRREDMPKRLRSRVTEMLLQSFLASRVRGQPQTLEPPAGERLHEIAVPTLIVEGDQDVADIRRIAALLERQIRGGRREVMRGVAHLLTLEKPSAFNELLGQFLRACEDERRVLEVSLTEVWLPTSRFEACLAFYRDVLGLQLVAGAGSPEGATFRTSGDPPGRILRLQAPGTSDGIALVMRVRNVDRAVSALRARGVSGVSDPEDDPDRGLRTATLRDPEGNRIMLVSEQPRTADR